MRRSKLWRELQDDGTSYLLKMGFLRSYDEGRPCDANGDPVPWMNYAVVAFLSERLTRDMTMFEFGSGYSTLYWSKLVGTVHSVESDPAWHATLADRFPENVSVQVIETDPDVLNPTYVAAPTTTGQLYDIVLIDGWHRDACAETVPRILAENGVVILDDTMYDIIKPAARVLESQGFRSITISGMKPTGFGWDQSTIFYRPGNCLGI